MRKCGECTLCCKLLPVHDGVMVNGVRQRGSIDKNAGERCVHQRHGKGCAVYNTRRMPNCCKVWNCRWLVSDDTADLSRPDRSHLVIDIMPDFVTLKNNETGETSDIEVVQVWCDPGYPTAHRDPQFRRYVERRAAEGKMVLVRFNSRDAITLVPPSMTSDGQWREQGGESVHRSEADIAERFGPMSITMTQEGQMHTKDFLAGELEKAGLHDMAAKARTGYYHDYLSPLDLPEMQLEADLRAVGTPEAEALRKRHLNGEFDANLEESEAWAKSPEGQDAMRRLVEKR